MSRKTKWADDRLGKPLVPLNNKQAEYIKAIRSNKTVISTGFAGTGKTYIAASIASEMLLKKEVAKIIITRPIVTVGKSVGLLPGTLEEKMEPWLKPIVETIIEKIGKGAFECAIKNKKIEIAPFEQMQGRSFSDAFILLTESQNCTEFELRMFLTRLGDNTKTVIDGDIKQRSLAQTSGLKKVLYLVKKFSLPVPVFEFELHEIVRSDQCLMWIEAFEAPDYQANLPVWEQRSNGHAWG